MAPRKKRVASVEKSTRTTRSRATKKPSEVTSPEVDNLQNEESEDALQDKKPSSEVTDISDAKECENVCETVTEIKLDEVLSPTLQLQPPEVEDECQKTSEAEVEIVNQISNLKVGESVESNADIEPMVVECEEIIETENIFSPKEESLQISEVNTEVLGLTNLSPPEITADPMEEAPSSSTENIKDDEVKEPQNDEIPSKPSSIKPKTKKASTPKSSKTKSNKIKKDTVLKKPSKIKKKVKKVIEKTNSDTSESSITSLENLVRRSSRIKCISDLKQKVQGVVRSNNGKDIKKGVKNSCNESDSSENSNSGQTDSEKTSTDSPNFLSPSVGSESDSKPVKVKSRWRRSSELEMGTNKNNGVDFMKQSTIKDDKNDDEDMRNRLKQFVHLKENQYLTSRLSCKVAKKMVCDCNVTPEEVDRGEMGCGEDCLNRLLMIECGQLCPVNDRCTNKRFQKSQFSPCEVFRTDKKGLGIRATANIPYGEFILEYIGEVIGPDEFEDRATEYSKGKNPHYYFMSLRADAVIDATQKGNISRFINHSCEPNAETQKWTVNGELRIGFFSTQTILAGEEITFDYQFQRYGKEAQKCYCEATNCRGWLGEQPDEDDDEEEDEEEEEEEEDEEVEKLEIEEKPAEVIKSEAEPVPMEIPVEVKETLPVEIKSVETKETEIVTSTAIPATVEVKKPVKKEKRKVIKRKVLKDIFDDVDVDEAIEMLLSTGLKNQAHTLKLSRLMIRANEPSQRSILLRILRHGEFPCRRLFLDYHGLRLIHGWMNDVQQMAKNDEKREPLRLELLQTLATLPIPNKTMLQDSKVLPTVEKWCVKLEVVAAEIDSESNSPKLETEIEAAPIEQSVEVQGKQQQKEKDEKVVVSTSKNSEVEMEDEDLEIRKSVGMLAKILSISKWIIEGSGTKLAEDIIAMFEDETEALNDEIKEKEQKLKEAKLAEKNYEIEIVALAVKLLEEWAGLKEVFRIPKKERIEQMKEHEREADRGYKAGLEHDSERKTNNRYRQHKRLKNDFDHRKNVKNDDRFSNCHHSNINKHERRKLFAMQVQHQEIERKQRDMWRQHELQCIAMGTDPRLTAPFDPTRNYTCIWNQQTRQWQNVPLSINQRSPIVNTKISRFSPALPFPFSGGNTITNMPPPLLHNVALPVPNMSQPAQNNPNFSHSQAFIPSPLTCPDMSQPPPNISQSPNLPHQSPIININHPPPKIPLPLTNVSHPGNNPMSIPPPSIRPNMLSNQPSNALLIQPLLSNNSQPPITYQEQISEKEDLSQVKFAGPIPPPVKLPPKWKCVKDKYSRPYYYHIKIRVPQWEPPEFPPLEVEEESSDSSSSSDTSSLSSDSSSEDSDEDDLSDTKLLMNIRKKVQQIEAKSDFNFVAEDKTNENPDVSASNLKVEMSENEKSTKSLDERLIEEFNLSKKESHAKAQSVKRKRSGLVTEVHIISPRSEEDKLYAKENSKKYKENKERLKKQKEVNVDQVKKRVKVTVKSAKPPKKHRSSAKAKLKETMDLNSESAKKIKESFRSNMAGVMVGILNPYRKPDCMEGKITNTEDFKHLARKLTHFVMLKELKHCQNIDDLTCTESVKLKAKEFVRKYMSKFGENYTRPKDDLEY